MRRAFALGTDDLLYFNGGFKIESRQVMDRADPALLSRDLERHPRKDIAGVLGATCIGFDVVDGVRRRATASKLFVLLAALVFFIEAAAAAPKTIEVLMGRAQWFNQLSCPLYAALDQLYEFAHRTTAAQTLSLEPVHLGELSLIVGLAPLWKAGISRGHGRADTFEVAPSVGQQHTTTGLSHLWTPRPSCARLQKVAHRLLQSSVSSAASRLLLWGEAFICTTYTFRLRTTPRMHRRWASSETNTKQLRKPATRRRSKNKPAEEQSEQVIVDCWQRLVVKSGALRVFWFCV